jgi:ABC-type antimicrobial peptide transport system permease subunit
VADARTVSVWRDPAPYLYEPLGESFLPKRVTLLVRGDGNPGAALAAARRVTRSLDATLPLFDVRSLAAQVESQLFEQIAVARLTTLFASVAVLLAAVGLYGLMSFVVSDRTREFGIRAALGARGRSLVAPVVRSAAALGLLGIVAGTAVSVALAGLVRSRLYGVEPLDVPTFVGAAALLALVALASTIVPAWRVARVDPLVALRRE